MKNKILLLHTIQDITKNTILIGVQIVLSTLVGIYLAH